MQSRTTRQFRDLLAVAPVHIRAKADACYALWSRNPAHPSLRFKKVHDTLPIYSVRIDRDWRAVSVLREGMAIWFWIGPHRVYERLLSQL